MSAKTLTNAAAKRYANAIFELAQESNLLKKVEADLGLIKSICDENYDFQRFILSAIFSRQQQIEVLKALGKKLDLESLTVDSLCLMASKRRLFAVKTMIEQFDLLVSNFRGEVKIVVTSSRKLSKSQENEIKDVFEKQTKSKIILQVNEDSTLIGGLVVRVGSSLIDSSIKSQLINVENKMKEVGI